MLGSREVGQMDGECRYPSLRRHYQYRAGDIGGYRADVSFFALREFMEVSTVLRMIL